WPQSGLGAGRPSAAQQAAREFARAAADVVHALAGAALVLVRGRLSWPAPTDRSTRLAGFTEQRRGGRLQSASSPGPARAVGRRRCGGGQWRALLLLVRHAAGRRHR